MEFYIHRKDAGEMLAKSIISEIPNPKFQISSKYQSEMTKTPHTSTLSLRERGF
jgi:hypothetical protein